MAKGRHVGQVLRLVLVVVIGLLVVSPAQGRVFQRQLTGTLSNYRLYVPTGQNVSHSQAIGKCRYLPGMGHLQQTQGALKDIIFFLHNSDLQRRGSNSPDVLWMHGGEAFTVSPSNWDTQQIKHNVGTAVAVCVEYARPCETPIQNGMIQQSGKVICNINFVYKPLSTGRAKRCVVGGSGEWEDFGTCEAITCSPRQIAHGRVLPDGGVQCEMGYFVQENNNGHTKRCDNGQWVNTAKCTACYREMLHGQIHLDGTVTCNHGYYHKLPRDGQRAHCDSRGYFVNFGSCEACGGQSIPNGNIKSDGTVECAPTYYYRKHSNGQQLTCGPDGTWANTGTCTLLEAPTGVQAEPKKAAIFVTWNAVGGHTLYNIRYLPRYSNVYEHIHNVRGNSYNIKDHLRWGTTYQISVAAVNGNAQGVYSSPVTAQSPDDPCNFSPCQNGGRCIAGSTFYTCKCARGYFGTDCENACSGQIANGNVSTNGNVLCNAGYHHQATHHAYNYQYCTSDGQWTNVGLCIKLPCNVYQQISNGYTTYTLDGTAHFHCNRGFVNHGHQTSTCNSTSHKWMTNTPRCGRAFYEVTLRQEYVVDGFGYVYNMTSLNTYTFDQAMEQCGKLPLSLWIGEDSYFNRNFAKINLMRLAQQFYNDYNGDVISLWVAGNQAFQLFKQSNRSSIHGASHLPLALAVCMQEVQAVGLSESLRPVLNIRYVMYSFAQHTFQEAKVRCKNSLPQSSNFNIAKGHLAKLLGRALEGIGSGSNNRMSVWFQSLNSQAYYISAQRDQNGLVTVTPPTVPTYSRKAWVICAEPDY